MESKSKQDYVNEVIYLKNYALELRTSVLLHYTKNYYKMLAFIFLLWYTEFDNKLYNLQIKGADIMLPIILSINDADDRKFVENIYNQYGEKIFKVAFNILKKEVDADDCFHDVIKIIIDDLDRFRSVDREQLINLLVKCTRNTAINKYNHEKMRHAIEISMYVDSDFDEDEREMEFVDDLGQYDNILINEENRKRLSELISELDVIYRDVLYLRYQMWMTNSEISRLLSIPENTVKVRLYRARNILLRTRSKELNELRKN